MSPERCSWLWLMLLLLVGLGGCSGEPETGPVPVHFDRDVCTRCRMVLSDPRFVAEVRWFPAAKRSQVAKFDDIGCATLWLAKQPFRSDPKTEIWVADYRSHKWLDARKAYYMKLNNSPMEYGLGAQSEPAPGALGFEQAKAYIRDVEAKFNVHGEQLKRRLEEQARRRAQDTKRHQAVNP